MEPTNEHERVIAKAVDKMLLENPADRHHLIVRDVAMSLGFSMTASDTQFLVRYIQWRRTRSAGASNSK
jgi:hypothetical protein